MCGNIGMKVYLRIMVIMAGWNIVPAGGILKEVMGIGLRCRRDMIHIACGILVK